MNVSELITAARGGNTRAVGRLLSLVEGERRDEVLAAVDTVPIPVIGVTGPPGAGKSRFGFDTPRRLVDAVPP